MQIRRRILLKSGGKGDIMGGRGATGARGARGGGLGGVLGGGGAFTITPNANGGVTITPNPNAAQNQVIPGAGSGVSDANTHTTYFTPADMATVSGSIATDGYRMSPRSGTMQVVGYYNTGDYYNINTELRDMANGRRTSLSPKTQKVVDAMDRNMRPLNAPVDSVRWTDMNAIRSNLGMPGHSSANDIVNRLKGGDIVGKKADYTSSSWDAKQNAVAGGAGRFVKIDMHYAKGAKVQFSPTRKEGEMVGARNADQRFSNARVQRMMVSNVRGGRRMADVLVLDCYVDQ